MPRHREGSGHGGEASKLMRFPGGSDGAGPTMRWSSRIGAIGIGGNGLFVKRM